MACRLGDRTTRSYIIHPQSSRFPDRRRRCSSSASRNSCARTPRFIFSESIGHVRAETQPAARYSCPARVHLLSSARRLLRYGEHCGSERWKRCRFLPLSRRGDRCRRRPRLQFLFGSRPRHGLDSVLLCKETGNFGSRGGAPRKVVTLMEASFLVSPVTVHTNGDGRALAIGPDRPPSLLITLGITKTIEQELLHVFIQGSRNGSD